MWIQMQQSVTTKLHPIGERCDMDNSRSFFREYDFRLGICENIVDLRCVDKPVKVGDRPGIGRLVTQPKKVAFDGDC